MDYTTPGGIPLRCPKCLSKNTLLTPVVLDPETFKPLRGAICRDCGLHSTKSDEFVVGGIRTYGEWLNENL